MNRLVLGCRAAALLAFLPSMAAAQASTYEQMQTLSGVLSHVRLNYVDSVDPGRMIQASIRGLLGALDPHSYYMSRAEFDLRMRWNRGELGSPGLWVDDGDGAVTVTTVVPEGPAARAGIQPGDRILRLGDLTVRGLGARAVEAALLGEKGSKVYMTLERGSRLLPDTFAVTLKRTALERRVIGVTRLVEPRTGYVQLGEFAPSAPEELARAIRKLQGSGARRVLLDLRGNGGGDMAAMTEIASSFLPEGSEVYRTQGRRKVGAETIVARKRGTFADLPLILLIDAGSASAAEILAGTLQDHDRALVVGRRSFGKALVQSSLPLANGDVVWLTTARVLTPSGRIIQRRYDGMETPQYLDRAGRGGEVEDTSRTYRTKGGRVVRGGGGIQPDVISPEPAPLPGWFAAAAEGGHDAAVADSVAALLPADAERRGTWMSDSAGWESRLVAPFIERMRAQLSSPLAPDSRVRARLGRILAARAAFSRWGPDSADEFVVRNDPDIELALVQIGRMGELLAAPGAP